MIYVGSRLDVADNSGGKKVICIKVLGGSGKDSAVLGEEVIVSVREATPNTKVKCGEIYHAVVVRTKKELRRSDGSYIKFDHNAVVLLNKQLEPVGTRVFGPMPRELRYKQYTKIISLAMEVQ